MPNFAFSLILFMFLLGCTQKGQETKVHIPVLRSAFPVENKIYEIPISRIPYVDGFDFPVGKPDAKGYYDAQGFQKTSSHLGEDWNGNGGGNTDLGDPVYSIANGIVAASEDWGGGWGNVVRIFHNRGNLNQANIIESFYAHLDTRPVKKGQIVKRGEQIGTIGDAYGAYPAHLHFELRWQAGLDVGGGYGDDTTGFLDPTAFIKANRPRR